MGSVRSRVARIRRGLRKVGKVFLLGRSKGNALAAFWLARGIAATSTRDFNRAEDCYHRAIAHSPLWADPHVALGNTLIGAGRAPDAIPSLEAALQIEPGRRDATWSWNGALYGLSM